MQEKYTALNAKAWDSWSKNGNIWSVPISHETFVAAQNGDWDVVLTPCIPVPKAWFGDLSGKKLLGLASGGGQQMPIFHAAGAHCTLMDLSDCQLASDRMVQQREGYTFPLVKADMTEPFPFPDATFDLIFHPVSNCYVEDVLPVWRECYRVLKPGGSLLSGVDNGINYLFADSDALPLTVTHALPYNPLKDPALLERDLQKNYGVQFSHSLEEQIGGQLQAGFTLKALFEDRDQPGQGNLRDYTPQYTATWAVK